MEPDSSAAAAAAAAAATAGGGSGSSDVEKKKLPEGEPKVKRKMKTASQLEILENTYAVETYPSEALRAELSVKLGLSDRQLQMWFCHRRLKDRKASTPVKRQKKEASPVAMADEMAVSGEIGKEHASGSGSRVSPLGLVDLQLQQQHHQQRVAHRPGTAVPRFRTEMPALKRYYEPPQAISELRAIAFVEAQLGQPLREDGPILGMEFDPLPPGAFGAPIVAAMQHKPVGRPFEAQIYERPDVNSIKGTTRTLHEYQFLPEQPSIRSDAYEQSVPSHYHSSIEVQSTRTMLSTGRSFMHGSEQVASGYSIPGQIPTLNLLPEGKQGHISPASAEADAVPRRSLVNIGVEANYGGQPMTSLESPFMPRVIHDEERLERKRKSEEARIAREVEAHEKRIRKELEKQDMLRRKREEQMRKDMERQDRERRKEEERLLREKLREEERYQREQRREMERREKFLLKESIKAEKMRLKEEMRREKEVARLKAANVRATARRIAKESTELIDDERLELMELAASKKGLPSILSLDSENLQNLEAFRDMLIEFPPKSVSLRKPFGVEPWICSEEDVGNLLMVWRFLITFSDVLRLWPFTLDEFVQAFHDFDPRLLAEIHIALLKLIIKDIEDVARTPASAVGANPNSGVNPGGGHPEIVEGAYAWGFDIRSWQRHLNALTWPEILRQFALSAGFGPKLKKQSVEPAYPRDENEGNDGADIISNLRSGVAAEKAVAKLQERGFSNPRRSRHRLTPGTVKFAAFHILSLEGSKGLNILEVAEKIQKSGLRDLKTSKTPEASISAALSRDTKLFERTAPSTYCLRDPYRKDPADADAILSAAREKIRVFKNECVNGEEAEDVEKEVERDDESESDAADDPEVDDLVSELKFAETPQSHKTDRTDGMNSTEDVSEILRFDLTQTPGDVSLQISTGIMHSESFGELKPIGTSGCQSAAIDADSSNLNQEDAVIDESNAGQKWVQGLTEGEYSDLTVEERLDALVALIGVANEGNSIRLVLEERLEAASALKKQIWAEAQLDKRRFKEEFLLKVQYPSVCNNAEQFCSVTSREARKSPLLAVDGHSEVAAIRSLQQEAMHKLPDESNNSSNVAVEKACPMQEIYGGQDNSQFQHFAYVAEKSRSQLKAYIGHRADETFVYRSLPLGQDRRRNRYWQFITSPSRNDPGSGRIFVELRDGRWRLIDSEKILTLLEDSIKREYLMSDYETTTELLGAVSNSNLDRMAVLPWVPHTTSAVALRLMELDSSLCYTQRQKADSLKDKESANFTTLKTNYADMKRVAGIISAEAPLEYENLEPDFSVKVGGRHGNSGQGRNHVRGAHSRVHGGRFQRKISASKSESAQRTSTKNSGRFDHLPAWKSRDRGKARRKRGRRSVRNRQKPVKNVENAAVEKVPIPSQQNWKEDEETAADQFEAPDNDSDPGTSGTEDDNGQATGDDYENLMADDYGTEPADGDDVDDYEDDHDEEDEEDGLADENVQRYFDAESEEEGNRLMDGELVENPNKDSESSSEYSD
ncbi:homeobox-DDT domain protein RLT2 isoform X2 [Nicotiana tabacum]|uniref:Homeobox-DDT domain protein RLT2 isoform X2 n=1 Tax=Nicotiana tabacum TaxID=4097 RepID=A0AC58T776_TOBAC